MARGVWQERIRDNSGRIVVGAAITIKNPISNAQVPVYAARSGGSPLTQPLVTGADGLIAFYCRTGRVNISIAWGGETQMVLRDYVIIDDFTPQHTPAYGLWFGSVNDSISRLAVKNARVRVSDPETGALLGLYADKEATKPIGNPFLTREDGAIKFYARAGRINVEAVGGNSQTDFDDEIVADNWGTVPDFVRLLVTAGYGNPGISAFELIDGVASNGLGPDADMDGRGYTAAFSPDGSLLAVGGLDAPYLTIFSVDTTTGALTRLATPGSPPTAEVNDVAFSPDGGLLVVAMAVSPYLLLYSVSATTITRLANISETPHYTAGLAFTPDGTYLAAAGHYSLGEMAIYSVSGTTLTRLANPTSSGIFDNFLGCSWNHDGTLLAVASYASPYLALYSRSGGTLTRLSSPAALPLASAYAARFSPAGDMLIVVTQSNGTRNVTRYSVSGATLTLISNIPSLDLSWNGYAASFSPDGAYLALGFDSGMKVYQVAGTTLTDVTGPATGPDNSVQAVAIMGAAP